MTISTSSQASAGSLSLFDGTEDVLECSAKSNHSVSESSQNTGRESLSSETSENSMEPDTKERGFSPEAFLASHSVAPGSERARKMTVSSGLRCVESYGKHNPNGCWQRMFLASLVKTEAWSSSVCLLTWKMQATKRSRLLFRLAALVLPTEGIGCGLLPTNQAMDGEVGDIHREVFWKGNSPRIKSNQGIEGQAKLGELLATLLPTTRATDWKNGGWHDTVTRKDSLNGVMSMLPTPTQGGFGDTNERALEKGQLHAVVADGMKSPGLKLQPGFALWMMGYPEDWCDLKDGE